MRWTLKINFRILGKAYLLYICCAVHSKCGWNMLFHVFCIKYKKGRKKEAKKPVFGACTHMLVWVLFSKKTCSALSWGKCEMGVKRVYYVAYFLPHFPFFFFLFYIFVQKTWKSIFWPAFGVRSIQMLVEIYITYFSNSQVLLHQRFTPLIS